MHITFRTQHPGIRNIARLADLLQNHAADSANTISQDKLHILTSREPPPTHPYPQLSHPHLFHQLLFCISGSCVLNYKGGSVRMEPGCIAVCTPLTHYETATETPAEPRLLSIFELGRRWTYFIEKCHCGTSGRILAVANARSNGIERNLFEKLVATGGYPGRRDILEQMLARYADALAEERRYRARNRLSEAGTMEKQRMADAVRLMLQRFPRDVSIVELADTCSITPDHFGKLFKKVFGVPPKEWMTNYRIYRAIDLMRGPDSLSRISERTGFGDQYYFSKAFKQHSGYAPSVYRKRFIRC